MPRPAPPPPQKPIFWPIQGTFGDLNVGGYDGPWADHRNAGGGLSVMDIAGARKWDYRDKNLAHIDAKGRMSKTMQRALPDSVHQTAYDDVQPSSSGAYVKPWRSIEAGSDPRYDIYVPPAPPPSFNPWAGKNPVVVATQETPDDSMRYQSLMASRYVKPTTYAFLDKSRRPALLGNTAEGSFYDPTDAPPIGYPLDGKRPPARPTGPIKWWECQGDGKKKNRGGEFTGPSCITDTAGWCLPGAGEYGTKCQFCGAELAGFMRVGSAGKGVGPLPPEAPPKHKSLRRFLGMKPKAR